MAADLGRTVVKNVVALGALQQATQICPKETFLNAIRRSLQEKCAMIPLNEEAFAWGARAVASASCLSPRSRPAGQAAWRSQSTSPR
ncbi:MAG TPA: hypothetical protein PK101_14615 [Thauera sp.]|nr:hypothetical protein [Thauera sp.]